MTDTTVPIRIKRNGFRTWFPVKREELRQACAFAESEARKITWKSPEALCRFLTWSIGEQLQVHIEALIEGVHDINDQPVISIHAGDFVHFVAVRGVPIEVEPEVVLKSKIAATFEKKSEPPPDVKAAVDKLVQTVGAKQTPSSTGSPARRK